MILASLHDPCLWRKFNIYILGEANYSSISDDDNLPKDRLIDREQADTGSGGSGGGIEQNKRTHVHGQEGGDCGGEGSGGGGEGIGGINGNGKFNKNEQF